MRIFNTSSVSNGLLKATLVSLVLVVAACTSSPEPLQIVARVNPAIDMSQYQTFAWISEDPLVGSRGLLTDRNKKRMEDNIVAALISKGYQQVSDPETADFAVSYTRGSRRTLTKSSYPETYRAGWTWNQPYYADARDMRSDRVSYSSSTVSSVYVENSLAVDVFDVRARELTWQGAAHKELTAEERKNPAEFLVEVVDDIFAPFPERK
jgi:hypothetical protein